MPVTSSTFTVGEPQADGRVWVTETHTFDTGDVQQLSYLADPTFDFQARLDARAAALTADELAIPYRITLVQAHRVVTAAGLKDRVEAVVAAATADVQALWYTSEFVEWNNPSLRALAAQIPLTDAQLADLFRQGSKS